jgi:hypothetical protein
MAASSTTCDVFLAHSASDIALARELAAACRSAGLEVFLDAGVPIEAKWEDLVWDALAESRAVLLLVPPAGPTAWMLLEIGAAQAWIKPVYAINTDPSSSRMPSVPPGVRFYTAGRIGDVIDAIRQSGQGLDEEDRAYLVDLYQKMNESVDQLTIHHHRLGKLVKAFNAARGKSATSERLLTELIRMRKQGRLPKLTAITRKSSGSQTA